jgi:hypothetical protein
VADYAFISNRFGVDVDFYSFQALLTARLFCVGKKDIIPDSCKLTTLTAGQQRIDFAGDKLLQSTTISPLNQIHQVLLKVKDSDYQLQTDYSDYTVANGITFPQKIAIQASNKKSKENCDFSILKVEFNTNVVLIPNNPDRFSRGDIDQLFKK